jgi:hypothetical protein
MSHSKARETTKMDKSKFIKVYANLPLGLRNEIVVVLDDVGPITWNAAYIEVDNETEVGQKILKRLHELEII